MFREGNDIFICKNDITTCYSFLVRRGFGSFNKTYLQREFDDYIDLHGYDEIKLTGSKMDKKRQRHTQFVNLYKFYNFVVKGKDR